MSASRRRKTELLRALGFASGLPSLLTAQTLGAWLAADGLTLAAIGAFALVGLPYSLKWLWAPLVDRYAWPFLGRRRGWLFVLALALAAGVGVMGLLSPRTQTVALAAAAFAVAFLSATFDLVADAYANDVLTPAERAAGSAAYVMGYRIALFASGALAFVLADHLPWGAIYGGMAALLAAGALLVLACEEPPAAAGRPATLDEAFVRPVAELLSLPRAGIILAFVALFKFGDYLAQPLLVPFLRLAGGFSFTEIGGLYQALGVAGVILGGTLAAPAVARLGLKRALLVLGAAQAATNLLYAWLAAAGHAPALLAVAVVADQTANAMGTAAFVSFLMSCCDPRVSATQVALLNSLSSVGQRVFGFLGASIVAGVGWTGFFCVTAAAAVPGLLLSAAAARASAASGTRGRA